jgi:hypothetical protein
VKNEAARQLFANNLYFKLLTNSFFGEEWRPRPAVLHVKRGIAPKMMWYRAKEWYHVKECGVSGSREPALAGSPPEAPMRMKLPLPDLLACWLAGSKKITASACWQ